MHFFDFRQLEIFSALASTGSFTAAAEKLFLTQSAVSHSIKTLESQLDCKLVERLGKTTVLTLAGEKLLQHARGIIERVELAIDEVSRISRPGYGRLKVGATQASCQYILPRVVDQFGKEFPDCDISIHPGDATELIQLVETGRIDLALCPRSNHTDHLDFKPLFEDELACILSPQSKLAGSKTLTPKSLQDQKLIVYARHSLTTRLIEAYFRKNGVPMPPLLEVGNMEAIKEFTRIGTGVGIVAPWIVLRERDDKSLLIRKLGPGRIRRVWGIYTHSQGSSSLIKASFEEACGRVCAEIATP